MRKVTDRTRPSFTVATCLEPAGGDVDDDPVLSFAALERPLVQRPRDERDRAVATCRRVAGVVEEDDAQIGSVVVRGHDVAAVHVGVPAGLEDEQPPDLVEALERRPGAVRGRWRLGAARLRP